MRSFLDKRQCMYHLQDAGHQQSVDSPLRQRHGSRLDVCDPARSSRCLAADGRGCTRVFERNNCANLIVFICTHYSALALRLTSGSTKASRVVQLVWRISRRSWSACAPTSCGFGFLRATERCTQGSRLVRLPRRWARNTPAV